MRRIERDAREDSMVIHLQDGSVQVFPNNLYLDFIAACWDEGIAAEKGEEYEWEPQLRRLKEALENATPASYDEFFGEWERWENANVEE